MLKVWETCVVWFWGVEWKGWAITVILYIPPSWLFPEATSYSQAVITRARVDKADTKFSVLWLWVCELDLRSSGFSFFDSSVPLRGYRVCFAWEESQEDQDRSHSFIPLSPTYLRLNIKGLPDYRSRSRVDSSKDLVNRDECVIHDPIRDGTSLTYLDCSLDHKLPSILSPVPHL
jgi:hypothetical protein